MYYLARAKQLRGSQLGLLHIARKLKITIIN